MGNPLGSDGLPDEAPQRLVYIGPFWIDRYEVTNETYADLSGQPDIARRQIRTLPPPCGKTMRRSPASATIPS